MHLQIPRQHLPTGRYLECGQYDTENGNSHAQRGVGHIAVGGHGDSHDDGYYRQYPFFGYGLFETDGHGDGDGGHEAAHYLVEVDGYVAEAGVSDANVEAEDDAEEEYEDVVPADDFSACDCSQHGLYVAARTGGGVGFVIVTFGCGCGCVFNVYFGKDYHGSNGVAEHVDEGEEVGIFEVYTGEGNLVEQGYSNVVDDPY